MCYLSDVQSRLALILQLHIQASLVRVFFSACYVFCDLTLTKNEYNQAEKNARIVQKTIMDFNERRRKTGDSAAKDTFAGRTIPGENHHPLVT